MQAGKAFFFTFKLFILAVIYFGLPAFSRFKGTDGSFFYAFANPGQIACVDAPAAQYFTDIAISCGLGHRGFEKNLALLLGR